ncbi:MAG TPA: nucleotide exchange factor GrpE [Bacteroidetes bacterium]|jgi:molecular chaperone GrpE|nr:nucleotide exchange factor GrpE [Candidatus Limimorpha avicola]
MENNNKNNDEQTLSDENINVGNDKEKEDKGKKNKNKSKKCDKQQNESQKIDELELKNSELEAKYADVNDKYIRLFSEFDNYRKRAAKERAELFKTASEDIIKKMLPILDDFERALQTMEKSDNKADFEGVTLIYNKLKTMLNQNGLEEIHAMDAEFDTDEHEALTSTPAPDESKKGKVLDVIQKGYKLNGKVIRYARVVVGS